MEELILCGGFRNVDDPWLENDTGNSKLRKVEFDIDSIAIRGENNNKIPPSEPRQ